MSHLLVDLSAKYQGSMSEEIKLMTSIEDPEHTIKNVEQSKQKEKEFSSKFKVKESFTMIDDEVLKISIERCEGNPLICLNFIFNLLTVSITLFMK